MKRALWIVSAWFGSAALLMGQQPLSWQIQPSPAVSFYVNSPAVGTFVATTQRALWLLSDNPSNRTIEWAPGGWIDHGATPLTNLGATIEAAIAHDPVTGETLLFGGSAYPTVLGNTYRWTGSAWAQMAPATVPPARRGAGLFYDPGRGRLLLVAGTGHNPVLPPNPALDRADTWEWSGSDWLPLTPMHQPTAGPCLVAFDSSRGRAVLLPRLASTMWEWDGSDWSEVVPSQMPPLAYRSGMTFDASRQRVLLQAGRTWEWDGVDWVQVTAADPVAWLPIVFDLARQRNVLVAGPSDASVWLSDNTPAQHIATATPYGVGCGTPLLRLESQGLPPLLGRTSQVRVTPLPVSQPGLTSAWISVGFGLLAGVAWPTPDCAWHHTSDIVGLPCSWGGYWSLSIPYTPSLRGLDLYLQGVALAPLQNDAWLVLSNGLHWKVGDN